MKNVVFGNENFQIFTTFTCAKRLLYVIEKSIYTEHFSVNRMASP